MARRGYVLKHVCGHDWTHSPAKYWSEESEKLKRSDARRDLDAGGSGLSYCFQRALVFPVAETGAQYPNVMTLSDDWHSVKRARPHVARYQFERGTDPCA